MLGAWRVMGRAWGSMVGASRVEGKGCTFHGDGVSGDALRVGWNRSRWVGGKRFVVSVTPEALFSKPQDVWETTAEAKRRPP